MAVVVVVCCRMNAVLKRMLLMQRVMEMFRRRLSHLDFTGAYSGNQFPAVAAKSLIAVAEMAIKGKQFIC